MIATRLGIAESDVTDKYIRARRDSRKLDTDGATSVVGGRTTDGLDHLNRKQVASALETYRQMTTESKKE